MKYLSTLYVIAQSNAQQCPPSALRCQTMTLNTMEYETALIEETDFYSALAQCKSFGDGWNLAGGTDENWNTAITQLMADYFLSSDDKVINSWTSIVEENGSWIDKNTEENMDAMYQNFAAGRPKTTVFTDNSVQAVKWKKTGEWCDVKADQLNRAICVKEQYTKMRCNSFTEAQGPYGPWACDSSCRHGEGCFCPPCWKMNDDKTKCVPMDEHVDITCEYEGAKVRVHECVTAREGPTAIPAFSIGTCLMSSVTEGTGETEIAKKMHFDPTDSSFHFTVNYDQCGFVYTQDEDNIYIDNKLSAEPQTSPNGVIQLAPRFEMKYQCSMYRKGQVSSEVLVLREMRMTQSFTGTTANIPDPTFTLKTYSDPQLQNEVIPGSPDGKFATGETVYFDTTVDNIVKRTSFLQKTCRVEDPNDTSDPKQFSLTLFGKCGANPLADLNAVADPEKFSETSLTGSFSAFLWTNGGSRTNRITCEVELCLNSGETTCIDECP